MTSALDSSTKQLFNAFNVLDCVRATYSSIGLASPIHQFLIKQEEGPCEFKGGYVKLIVILLCIESREGNRSVIYHLTTLKSDAETASRANCVKSLLSLC